MTALASPCGAHALPQKWEKPCWGRPGVFTRALVLDHLPIAFMGRHPACPGPEPGEPSQSLRACRTMRFGSTAKVPLKCKLKYYRISECVASCPLLTEVMWVRRIPSIGPRPSRYCSHEWMRENGTASERPLNNVILQRMRVFANHNMFKKKALQVIASTMNAEEIAGLRSLFQVMHLSVSRLQKHSSTQPSSAPAQWSSPVAVYRLCMSSKPSLVDTLAGYGPIGWNHPQACSVGDGIARQESSSVCQCHHRQGSVALSLTPTPLPALPPVHHLEVANAAAAPDIHYG